MRPDDEARVAWRCARLREVWKMWKSKLGVSLLFGSSVLLACTSGSISEPGPATLDEVQDDDALDADLASNELRFRRYVAGSAAPAPWDRYQRLADYWRKRRGGNGSGGKGGAGATGGTGGGP